MNQISTLNRIGNCILVWAIWYGLSRKYINNISSRRFLQWRQFYDWKEKKTKKPFSKTSTAHVELWRSSLSEYPDNLSASNRICCNTWWFWWMLSNCAMQDTLFFHSLYAPFKWTDLFLIFYLYAEISFFPEEKNIFHCETKITLRYNSSIRKARHIILINLFFVLSSAGTTKPYSLSPPP